MRAALIVIGTIRSQNLPQMPRAEDKNVIQTVTPKRSDQAFNVWILPRSIRRGCGGRPTTGSPYSSAGSDRVARARFWASLADLGISSANRPEILRDAIAGWYRVEQFEPNRAGLARAASSTPAGSDHSPAAGDVVVLASGRR